MPFSDPRRARNMARGWDVFIVRFVRTWPTRRVFPPESNATGSAIILYVSVYAAIRIALRSTMRLLPPTRISVSVCPSVWTCLIINARVCLFCLSNVFFFILSPRRLLPLRVSSCKYAHARPEHERFQGYRRDKKKKPTLWRAINYLPLRICYAFWQTWYHTVFTVFGEKTALCWKLKSIIYKTVCFHRIRVSLSDNTFTVLTRFRTIFFLNVFYVFDQIEFIPVEFSKSV